MFMLLEYKSIVPILFANELLLYTFRSYTVDLRGTTYLQSPFQKKDVKKINKSAFRQVEDKRPHNFLVWKLAM